MLIIRNTQFRALSQQPREQFIEEMLGHLYSYFPAAAWLLTPEELRGQVNALIARAAAYQLTSRQQVCRFINLAATYGWQFDSDPDLLWMRDILTDTSLSQPSERLDRLVQTCLHRQHIEERNRALHQQLGLTPVRNSSVLEQDMTGDYLDKLYTNTQPTEATTEEIITRNPLSYHLSQSLWISPEIMPPMNLRPAIPAWVNDIKSMLHRKKGGYHVLGS
jgi:hypothetical protein